MEAPVLARRHKPFLAPIWLSVLLALIVVGAALFAYRSATTTMIVIAPAPAIGLGAVADPPLDREGEQRAERLARLFSGTAREARIDAIYVSASRGAQQSAAPLAARLGMQPVALAEGDTAFANRALSEHRGGAVLVVASASLIPQLVESLSGIKLAALPADDSGTLFVVSVPTFGSAALLEIHY